jgi:hypothetical protein
MEMSLNLTWVGKLTTQRLTDKLTKEQTNRGYKKPEPKPKSKNSFLTTGNRIFILRFGSGFG